MLRTPCKLGFLRRCSDAGYATTNANVITLREIAVLGSRRRQQRRQSEDMLRTVADSPHRGTARVNTMGALANDTVAVVLAGRKGTRLDPLTRHVCKPALPFGGRLPQHRFLVVQVRELIAGRAWCTYRTDQGRDGTGVIEMATTSADRRCAITASDRDSLLRTCPRSQTRSDRGVGYPRSWITAT